MDTSVRSQISEAAQLLKERRFAEANALSDRLLAAFPRHPDLRHLKALCCRNLGEFAGCLKWARLTLEVVPGHGPALGLLREVYSRPQFRWLRFLYAEPVDLVIDVGGNTGGFGLELRRSGYGGRILSIEPVEEAFGRLAAVRQGDALWDARLMALGRTAGSMTINVAANDAASSSILPMSGRQLGAAPESRIIGRQEVSVDTLDHLFSDLADKGASRLLKLDTQGYEGEILAGAAAVLPLFKFVYVELSVTRLYDGQALMHEVLGTLYAAGFEVIDLQPYMVEPATGHLLQLNGMLRNLGRG
jgi:FkbM family methyltransferase